MKIKGQKQYLLKALQSISGVAVQRDIYPILENVRISTMERKLLLRATDLKISISYTIAEDYVEIIEEGELLLPALKLYNLLKETPDKEITLQKEELNGLLCTEDGKFCILGEDPQKFPEVPEFQEQGSIKVLGEDFKKLIKKTLFATTSEKTRYDLDNVLFDIIDDTIRLVSTDGKRLAVCEKKYQAIEDIENKRFTVPAVGLQQIDRVLSATTPEEVMLSIVESQLLFRTEDVVLSTRLSEAKFPPYEKVIPNVLPFRATFQNKEFTSALKRVCLLADEKNKIVEISFTATTLKLFARGEGTGEANVDVAVVYDGEPFQIKFNPHFLLDALKVVESIELQFLVQDGQSAVLLKDGEDFRYVVLPIKVEERAGDGA